MWKTAAPCLIALSCLGACAKSSDKVATGDIDPTFRAEVDSNGVAEVSAVLETGTVVKKLRLAEGDVLEAQHGKVTVPLAESELDGESLVYRAALQDVREGEEITVAFNRAAREDAPSSVAIVPADFDLTGPAPGDTFSRAKDAIEITWAPSAGGEMHYSLDGDCIFYRERSEPDSGSITLDPGTLEFGVGGGDETGDTGTAATQKPDEDTCDVTIRLERRMEGTVDPAYGDDCCFTGIQVRELTIVSAP